MYIIIFNPEWTQVLITGIQCTINPCVLHGIFMILGEQLNIYAEMK